MYEYQTPHEFALRGWVKHRLPWLAIFAFIVGLMHDQGDDDADSDMFYG